MDKKDIKYIFRRVITFFIIFFILLFFKSCKVNAETRNIFNDGTQVRYYPDSSYHTINFNQWNTITSNNSMYGIIFRLDSNGQDHFEAGQYLFDFYIETNNLTNHLASCNGINADFSFYDLTSNAWVSAANRSKSACIDSYYTTIGGNRTIHYLFSWTITNGTTYDALFTQMKFDIYNYTGAGFVDYNGSFMVILGTLQDYDANIVQNFTNVAEQQRLNQQVILNATQNAQNIINNQTQNTQDILNSQALINQNINNIGQDTSTIINQQQQNAQQAHQDSQEIKDAMTDTSSPSNLDGLSQSAGWLPPGPVDSILNLPLSLLNNISDNLSKSCQPVVLTIPYVNSTLTLPCLNTLYDQMGVGPLLSFIGTIASCFILLSYLIKLYKWVDDTLTFRENNQIDNWGGI